MFRNVRTTLVSFIFFGLSSLAYCQDAQIQGQVLDQSGAGILRALVRIVDQRTGTEAKTETRENGQYTVPALTPGPYKIIVEAAGFSSAVSDPITLNPGQNAILNFTLKVGGNSVDVVVTAEKREENLQDVPVPVSAIDSEQLASNEQVRIRDFTENIPSFNVEPENFNQEIISIRGVTTGGFTLPTVGTTIDGVPYGILLTVADIDPGDLARVEVLRGPQGTLYGANSMGGLVNFVTQDPSFSGIHGRVEAGGNAVSNGDQPGYLLRASIDLPITHNLAIRGGGFTRGEPGYISNPFYHLHNLNAQRGYGGRVALLWQPRSVFSIKLSALFDNLQADGSSWVNIGPGLGDLQQNYVANTGGSGRSIEAYSATVKAKVSKIDVVSLTGLNDDYGPSSFDWSNTFGPLVEPVFGVTGAPYLDYARDTRQTEEIRVSSSLGKRLDWLAGGFFSNADLHGYGHVDAAVPSTGQILGLFWGLNYPRNYQERAVFGDITYRFTPRFDVQFGGRESHDREYQAVDIQDGPYVGATPVIAPPVQSQADAFTYLVTPRYKISDELMVYGRFASGYRPGGPNTNAPGLPRQYNPDKTQNYEGGVKGALFHRILTLDASGYYINWRDIQIQKFSSSNLSFTTNGSSAKSAGVELAGNVRAYRGLTAAGWFAFDDAVLTGAFPTNGPLYGMPGNRLPFSSRCSGNLSVNDEIPLGEASSVFFGGGANFIGDRVGVFTGTPRRQDMPAYTKAELRAGFRYKLWTGSVFVNNIGDERGIINGGVGYFDPTSFLYINPRTAVLSLTRTF